MRHHNSHHTFGSRDGFTLLEMLVVITLIGVLAGLAMPNFVRMLDSFGEAAHWRAFENELDGMSLRAFNEGVSFSLTTESAPRVLRAVPPGWQVVVKVSIRYQSNGWCDGGVMRLERTGEPAREYTLTSPRCAVGAK